MALRSRDPFGAVLEELRSQIRGGQIPPGEPLIVMDLARTLGISATPVREGLAYLAGEGLIDGRRGKVRGYATWRLSAADLAGLYRLHSAQVVLALGEGGRQGGRMNIKDVPHQMLDAAPESGERLAAVTEALFARMVQAAGSPVILRAHHVVAERLHLVRLQEPAVFGDVEAELRSLANMEGGGIALVQAVRAYHRRRIVKLDQLLGALRRRHT